MPYRRHLSNSSSLVTTYEEIRSGFIALALEKNRLSTPYIEEARALKTVASSASTPRELLEITELRKALLRAAGISEKAERHIADDDELSAISDFIDNYLEPAGSAFVEELVFRFLITAGDAMGGKFKNLVGVLAHLKICRALFSVLRIKNREYK